MRTINLVNSIQNPNSKVYPVAFFFSVISSADITQMRTGPGGWGFQRRSNRLTLADLADDWLPSFGISALSTKSKGIKSVFYVHAS